MKNTQLRRHWGALAVLAALIFSAGSGFCNGDLAFATAWSNALQSRARLIVAGAGPAAWRAGIEVSLAPHTLTYWRVPGDAGTPPNVSYAGSINLGSAELAYPAPRRLDEDGIEAFGYLERVVFPLRVRAADPHKPVTLRVAFNYAACQRICVPVHAAWELALPPGTRASPFEEEIAAAEAQVPVKKSLGGQDGVRIEAVHAITGDLAAGKGRFSVDAHVRSRETPVWLFAEAPQGWYLQPAQGKPQADGSVRFDVPVLQAPSGALPRKTPLTLTLTAGSEAIEVPADLDMRPGAS